MSIYDICQSLGYDLKRNRRDALGNLWAYAVYPTVAGGVNYFDDQQEVAEWTRQVSEKRKWEAGGEAK